MNAFPDATFVYLLREPTPWFTSFTRAFDTTPGDGAVKYVAHLNELKDMVTAHPHTMVLHYKDLIEQPRQVVEAIMARAGSRLSDDDRAHISKVSATDSQQGTRLSKDRLKGKTVPPERIEAFKATFLAKLNANAMDLRITTSAISNEPVLLD